MIEASAVGGGVAVAVAETAVGVAVGKGVAVAAGRAVRVGVAVICIFPPQADKQNWPNISVISIAPTNRLRDLF